MNLRSLLLATCAIALVACQPQPQNAATPQADNAPAETSAQVIDEHSFAEPHKVATRSLALDLAMDFEARQLSGTATLDLEWKDPTADQLVLDTRELTIEKVESLAGEQPQALTFALDEAHPIYGTALRIEAPARPAQVRITYRTAPSASGLQWLTPAMTQGKKIPFMFSQSQQIHARSWVPVQDTPLVRFTYRARVVTRKDVMVVMSAATAPGPDGSGMTRDGEYHFDMPQPIPSYLLAIAAGDLAFRDLGKRSGVWAEPAMLDKAAAEFADTEKMMEITERLYGPYRWDRYDSVVLPPSFPYGGMENPRMTFLTPTVIVGDKSLVALVAHELAHSWSGNLVTFATANDAWLNEGFTSYLDNRIIEELFGAERAQMESVIDRAEIAREYTAENVALQSLVIKPGTLKDPDDNLTATVYHKGAWFLQFLEQRIGRDEFDAFLRGYFDHFAFQAITSAQFADYAKRELLDKHPGKVSQAEFDEWLYQPGIPATAPKIVSARMDAVDAARSAWLKDGSLPEAKVSGAWSTQEWVRFIEGMPETLGQEQLKQLDAAFKLTGTANGEIAQRWYPLTVRSGYVEARPAIAAFLGKVGRRKLVMPIYTALAATPEGLAFAREVFAKAKSGLHPLTVGSVEGVLNKPAQPAG